MSCPHSNAIGSTPLRCSLCLSAVPKKMAIIDKMVYEDGEPIGLLTEINRSRYEAETQNSLPQRRKSCGRCGQSGHNRITCDVKLTENDESLN